MKRLSTTITTVVIDLSHIRSKQYLLVFFYEIRQMIELIGN